MAYPPRKIKFDSKKFLETVTVPVSRQRLEKLQQAKMVMPQAEKVQSDISNAFQLPKENIEKLNEPTITEQQEQGYGKGLKILPFDITAPTPIQGIQLGQELLTEDVGGKIKGLAEDLKFYGDVMFGDTPTKTMAFFNHPATRSLTERWVKEIENAPKPKGLKISNALGTYVQTAFLPISMLFETGGKVPYVGETVVNAMMTPLNALGVLTTELTKSISPYDNEKDNEELRQGLNESIPVLALGLYGKFKKLGLLDKSVKDPEVQKVVKDYKENEAVKYIEQKFQLTEGQKGQPTKTETGLILDESGKPKIEQVTSPTEGRYEVDEQGNVIPIKERQAGEFPFTGPVEPLKPAGNIEGTKGETMIMPPLQIGKLPEIKKIIKPPEPQKLLENRKSEINIKDFYSSRFSEEANKEHIKIVKGKDNKEYVIQKAFNEDYFIVYDGNKNEIGRAYFDTTNQDYFTGYTNAQSIKIKPEYRRQGLATNIIKFAEEYYKKPYEPTELLSEEMTEVVKKNFTKTVQAKQIVLDKIKNKVEELSQQLIDANNEGKPVKPIYDKLKQYESEANNLEKEISDVTQNQQGLSGKIGEGKEPVKTEPVKETSTKETSTSGVLETPVSGKEVKFSDIEEANNYIEQKSKEFGGKNKFLSSDEYKKIYPEIERVYLDAQRQFKEKGEKALKEKGQDYGDRVEYSIANPFGETFVYEGTIEKRDGLPYVRLDKTVNNKKYVRWHKGFEKLQTPVPEQVKPKFKEVNYDELEGKAPYEMSKDDFASVKWKAFDFNEQFKPEDFYKQHENSVKKAYSEGKDIPDNVLKEYGLEKKYKYEGEKIPNKINREYTGDTYTDKSTGIEYKFKGRYTPQGKRIATGYEYEPVYTPEMRKIRNEKLKSEVTSGLKPVEKLIVENPRSELPESVSLKLQDKAEQLLKEVEGASVTKKGAYYNADLDKATGSFTTNTFPEWFRELDMNKKDVMTALKKIITDKGQDKGVSVEKVKVKIIEHLTKGRRDADVSMVSGRRLNTKDYFTPAEDKALTEFLNKFKDDKITLEEFAKMEKDFEGLDAEKMKSEKANYELERLQLEKKSLESEVKSGDIFGKAEKELAKVNKRIEELSKSEIVKEPSIDYRTGLRNYRKTENPITMESVQKRKSEREARLDKAYKLSEPGLKIRAYDLYEEAVPSLKKKVKLFEQISADYLNGGDEFLRKPETFYHVPKEHINEVTLPRYYRERKIYGVRDVKERPLKFKEKITYISDTPGKEVNIGNRDVNLVYNYRNEGLSKYKINTEDLGERLSLMQKDKSSYKNVYIEDRSLYDLSEKTKLPKHTEELIKRTEQITGKRIISEESYQQAKKNLGKLPDNLSSNPVDFYAKKVKDLTVIGSYWIENGIRKFPDWSKKMIEEVGEWVRPKLEELYNRTLIKNAPEGKSYYGKYLPNVRGEWTEQKILRELKARKLVGRRFGKKGINREISKFENAKEFEDNIYYHGTPNYPEGALKPSITFSDRRIEREGGGGYGEKYYAISLSKDKNTASNFTSMSRYGEVYPVILKKGAKVIKMPLIQDSIELNDYIVDLWNKGIDAVKIGDWKSEFSEKELAVINPFSIFKYEVPERFAVYGKKRFENLTFDKVQEIYNKSKENVTELDRIKHTQGLTKEQRQEEIKKIDDYHFATLLPLDKNSLKTWDNFKSNAELFKSVTNEGIQLVKRGINNFRVWSERMIKNIGEWVKPHLRNLWNTINQTETKARLEEKGIRLNTSGISGDTFKRKDETLSQWRERIEKLKEKPKTEIVKEEVIKPKEEVDYKKIKERTYRHRIKTGDKKSEYEFNEKTVSPDIVKEVEDYVKNNIGVMRELRRNRISDKMAINKAVKLAENLDDAKILSIRRGDAMPIEEHLATVVYTSKRIKDTINDPIATPIDISNVFLMWAKTEAISGELGRSLRARQLVPQFNLNELNLLRDKLPEELRNEYNKLLDEAKKKQEPDAYDKIKYWLYNAMLSNPITHARNMVGNISHLTYESVLNGVMNPVLTVKGLSKGFTNIIPRIKEIMKGSEETNKWFEGRRYEPKNKIVRNTMPLKWLEIEDVVFKELSKGMEREFQIKGLSKQFKDNPQETRQLLQDVLEGRELETEEKTQRYLQALEDIDKYGKYVTFQSELGGVGKSFTNFINKSKAGFLVVPFIRTPINIMKVGLQPLKVMKFVSPEYRAKFKELSKSEQTHIYRRIAAGSLLYSVIAGLALNGEIEITGSGPDDRTKRDLLERQGWKPNSIKVGSKYVSYQNLNPVNILFGMIGNYSDNMKYNTKPKDDELSAIQKISKTLAGFAETFTDQSFLQGINNLFKWVNKKDPYYLEQFLQMPVPGVLAIKKSIDILKGEELPSYEAKGFMEKLKNKIGYTEGLKERLDIFGDTKIRTYESLPIPYSEKEDRLAKLILDNDISIGYPSKSVTKPDGTKITEDEYYTYHQETGQEIKRVLTENYDEISKLTPDEMEKFIDDITRDIRKNARERLFGKKTRESISYQTMDALSNMNNKKPSIRRPKSKKPYEKKY